MGQPAASGAQVTVARATVAPGTSVAIEASGFAANRIVNIGFGLPASEFSVIRQAQTDAARRLRTSVVVPSWADRGRAYVIVVDAPNAPPRAVSDAFGVGMPGDSISVQGTLTDESVECPALRGPDGALYTLATQNLEFGPGTEVSVRGTIAEVSMCMQGATLNVRSIERR